MTIMGTSGRRRSAGMKKGLTIKDVSDGDVVRVNGETYRLMIFGHNAWGCRKLLEDGEWSDEHYWYSHSVEVEALIRKNPSNKKSRPAKECVTDPLMGIRE